MPHSGVQSCVGKPNDLFDQIITQHDRSGVAPNIVRPVGQLEHQSAPSLLTGKYRTQPTRNMRNPGVRRPTTELRSHHLQCAIDIGFSKGCHFIGPFTRNLQQRECLYAMGRTERCDPRFVRRVPNHDSRPLRGADVPSGLQLTFESAKPRGHQLLHAHGKRLPDLFLHRRPQLQQLLVGQLFCLRIAYCSRREGMLASPGLGKAVLFPFVRL